MEIPAHEKQWQEEIPKGDHLQAVKIRMVGSPTLLFVIAVAALNAAQVSVRSATIIMLLRKGKKGSKTVSCQSHAVVIVAYVGSGVASGPNEKIPSYFLFHYSP